MKTSTYYHESYDGGLNDTAHASNIERNQASYLRNWDITYTGQLKRRDGILQKGSDVGDNIDGAGLYLRNAGGKDIMVVEGGALHYLNSTTFDQLDDGFTDNKMTALEYCPLNDKLYISNESDTMHVWDRASVVKNSCLTDLGNTKPSGGVLRWHKNHMFVTNNAHVGGVTYQQRLYWSAMGDPETYDTTNDFVNVPGFGRVIALGDLGNSLVIFKEYAINYLTGWGDTDWQITASSSNVATISEAVGIAGPRAHVRVGNEIWFMDDEGSIRRLYQTDFDAFRTDIISKNIVGTLNSINKTYLHLVCAYANDNKVYFAIPTGTSTYNDLVLVFDIKASKRNKGKEAWTTYDGWYPSVFFDYPTSTTPDLYFADKNGKVFLHTGDDDNGVAITARWDGREDDFDKPERYKRYRYGYITAPSSTTATVGVYASIDDAAFADLGDITIAPTGGTLGPTGTFELGPTGTTAILGGSGSDTLKYYYTSGGGTPTGKSHMLSIRHSVLNQQPIVNGFTVHYKQRSLR